MVTDVLRLADVDRRSLEYLFQRIGLELVPVPTGSPIPASYWGDDEAGLRGARLYARADTPLHSVLHETSHFICMDEARRKSLDTDAGSDNEEESAVCLLQLLLGDLLEFADRERMYRDMDAWGYSFRLGSTRAWFEQDADDARNWLIEKGLVDLESTPRLILRGPGPDPPRR